MASYSVAGLEAFVIVIIVLSTLAIFLRFWSRLVTTGLRLGWDDWLAFAAWPFALAQMSVVLVGARSGYLGKHLFDEGVLQHLTWALKLLVSANALFNTSISLSRLSAMAFYARIFPLRRDSQNASWRISFWTVTALCIAWPLAMIPMNLFNCRPIERLWLPLLPGTCMTQFDIYMISGATSVFVDILVLLLPLPKIFALNLEWRKKLYVTFGFVIGYSVLFMSVGRMVQTSYVNKKLNTDPLYEIVSMAYWIEAEVGLSILAICLPAIFQLGKRAATSGFHSLLSSKDFSRIDYEMKGKSAASKNTTKNNSKNASKIASTNLSINDAERGRYSQASDEPVIGRNGQQNRGSY